MVYEPFLDLLIAKTEAITIGDPTDRANWLGPVISQRAVDRYEAAVAEARRDGRVIIGGERVTEDGLGGGFFVAPTVAIDLPTSHRLFRDELFVPFTVVAPIDSLDEGLELANDNVYGPWPGVQPFGGWKGSGTTGKSAGGHHYVQQYLREQSQTIVG